MRGRIAAAAVVLVGIAAPALAAEGGESFLGIPMPAWKAVNLLFFLAALVWFVGRPLGRFLESRRDGIRYELKEARRKLAEAEELRAQVLKRLEEVEVEVEEIRARAEREGAAERERILASAEEEEKRLLRRVDDEIDRRTMETRQRLAEDTAALTAQLARELLEREITESDRERVLERSLVALRAQAKEE